MWICMSDAFLSVVQVRGNPDLLMVRSRKRSHLEKLFPNEEIGVSSDSDYRFRVFVERKVVAKIMADQVNGIAYTNFKNSVREKKLREMYSRWWADHYDYQISEIEEDKWRELYENGD